MTKGSRKIFFGIVIASIHIRVLELLLFPACFGYAVLYFGVCDLTREKERVSMTYQQGRRLRVLTGALVIVSALMEFLSAARYLSPADVGQLLPFLLEYAVFYQLMKRYASLNHAVLAVQKGYALVMGAALLGFGASLFLHSAVWQIFSGVVILVCRLMVLFTAWGDKIRVDSPGKL